MPETLPRNEVRKPPCNRTVGIEIELGLKPFTHSWSDGHKGFWYAGYDGSICHLPYGWVGIEMVSQPLTVPWMRRELDKLFKTINLHSPIVNNTMGIHVHVNRNWLTLKRGQAILKFLRERGDSELHELFGRKPCTYARRDANMDSRYSMINFTNKYTIEVRLFASGNHPTWWKWCIDFTEYLVVNAKHLNIDSAYAYKDWWETTNGKASPIQEA